MKSSLLAALLLILSISSTWAQYTGEAPYEEYYNEEEKEEEEYIPPVEEEEEEYVPPVEEEEEIYEEEEEEEYVPPYYEEYGEGYVSGNGYGYGTPTYEEYYEEAPPQESKEEYYNEDTNYGQPYEEEYNEETEEYTPPPKYPPSYKTGYVVDIHFLAGDPKFQYIAYHFCQELWKGFSQCDIYNSTNKNAKLMATEYVVSADIFANLPEGEKKYWHSHAFAVKSGILVSPNTPPDQDLAVMSSVINTYGKITDYWHSYQKFPYGGAKLAYGLGEESQVIPELVQEMDRMLGLSTTWKQRAELRSGLQADVLPGADAYLTTGKYPQYVVETFDVPPEQNEEESEENDGGNSNEETIEEESNGGAEEVVEGGGEETTESNEEETSAEETQ